MRLCTQSRFLSFYLWGLQGFAPCRLFLLLPYSLTTHPVRSHPHTHGT